jgi:hypothetical protein
VLRATFDHGFPPRDWEDAKAEATRILIGYARRNRTIAYSDLVAQIPQIDLSAYDDRLFHFLGEIGEAEANAGRGILTATVVHKNGDRSPGGGFYELAKSLGNKFTDRDRFWIEELNRVCAYWKNAATTQPVAPNTAEFERLAVSIPSYPGSHPYSRSARPKFYRQAELGDTAEGDTNRTRFFEKVLVGIFWKINRAVPYAFFTESGETRSLDAGCVKFLLNRPQPRLKLICNAAGAIIAVEPTGALEDTYRELRAKLVEAVSPEEPLVPFDLDLDSPVDERRRMVSEQAVRDGAAAFRAAVFAAWNNRCAVTKTSIDTVLDAAHIYRYLGPKTNDVRNGLPLRADIHRLFDKYLLSIVPNESGAKVMVSKTLSSTRYGKLDGTSVSFPPSRATRPDRQVLEHHACEFREAEKAR